MGKLEGFVKGPLGSPVARGGSPGRPAVVYFADTGNTVRVESPDYVPVSAPNAFEGYEQMTLHVERECTDEEGQDTSETNLEHLHIKQDAAKAFWQLFEAIREAPFRENGRVFMYPVVPSEDIRFNPLVRSCESQWIYEGKCLVQQAGIGKGIPAIEITDRQWAAAVKRLGEGNPVPVYTRFALDAIYFAEHDPPRGIIMACAAWENALRY